MVIFQCDTCREYYKREDVIEKSEKHFICDRCFDNQTWKEIKGKVVVHHKDADTFNNRAENLTWATYKENNDERNSF